jgi:hypothetical protein
MLGGVLLTDPVSLPTSRLYPRSRLPSTHPLTSAVPVRRYPSSTVMARANVPYCVDMAKAGKIDRDRISPAWIHRGAGWTAVRLLTSRLSLKTSLSVDSPPTHTLSCLLTPALRVPRPQTPPPHVVSLVNTAGLLDDPPKPTVRVVAWCVGGCESVRHGTPRTLTGERGHGSAVAASTRRQAAGAITSRLVAALHSGTYPPTVRKLALRPLRRALPFVRCVSVAAAIRSAPLCPCHCSPWAELCVSVSFCRAGDVCCDQCGHPGPRGSPPRQRPPWKPAGAFSRSAMVCVGVRVCVWVCERAGAAER